MDRKGLYLHIYKLLAKKLRLPLTPLSQHRSILDFMQINIPLRKGDFDTFGIKPLVDIPAEGMNQPSPIMRSGSPAKQLEFKGGITESTKSYPWFRVGNG